MDEPPVEAYSRVTNPERFRALHSGARTILAGLAQRYDVTKTDRIETVAEFDDELAVIRLTPSSPDAAALAVAFTDFPGLYLWAGRWHSSPWPVCGCDACDEQFEDVWQSFADSISDVVAGRFHEKLTTRCGGPWIEFDFSERGGGGVASGVGGEARSLQWQPWTERWRSVASQPSAMMDSSRSRPLSM